ncbi:MAG: threonylcarbamoyl-AMP synthase [Chitinophagaceae bacterium]|nr:threonylcarbamoyl-AMP synthase [Chitinophagaceae bacterium]
MTAGFSEQDMQAALTTLRNGGIILYPTDTVWGIGCDATNENAVERIYQLKQRDDSRALIILLASERDLLQYVASPDPAVFDFLETISKPTTIVYDSAIGLAENLIAGDGTVGIRITNDDFCKQLIKRFRKPIVSTSANISGQPTPPDFKSIDPLIIHGVDYVVRYRQDDPSNSPPSSVIKWNKDGTQTIIRL